MKAIVGIALSLFVGSALADSQCPSGGSAYNPKKNKFPVQDSDCFSEDLNHMTAFPGDCQQYLYCDPTDCAWRQGECDGGKFWNNYEGQCVEAQNADCGGALFWSGALVQIENVLYEKVIDDCRSCGGRNWYDPTPVIGFATNGYPDWNQRLVAKRRHNSEYYSLAFDKGAGDDVKVIQDVGNDKVISKMLVSSRPRPSMWRFVPIPGKKNKIQIISVSTGKALIMGRIEGEREFHAGVTDRINPNDKRQQWIVVDIDGAPVPFR